MKVSISFLLHHAKLQNFGADAGGQTLSVSDECNNTVGDLPGLVYSCMQVIAGELLPQTCTCIMDFSFQHFVHISRFHITQNKLGACNSSTHQMTPLLPKCFIGYFNMFGLMPVGKPKL